MRELRDHLPGHRFVLRTDVKSCYASINYVPLVDQLAAHISDRRVLNLGLFYIRFMDDILVLARRGGTVRRGQGGQSAARVRPIWRSTRTRPSSAGSSAASTS